ncbi:MAG: CHAT domain-containing protein [bacterium]
MSAQRARPAKQRAERILHLFERGEIGGYLKKNEEAVDLSVLLVLKREVERLVRVDARRALRLATVMERLLVHISDPKARAVASRAKAEALLFLGRFQLALDTYQETVRLYTEGGDVLEGARASIAEIPALAYLSRYDEAFTVARDAESALRKHGERAYLGRLYMNKGNLYFHMDRYREALAYYKKARRYLGLVSGRDETVVGLEINEAVIYTDLDEAKPAEVLLRGAIERAGAMRWTSLAAQAEFNLARVFALDSRYQEALGAFARAGEVFEREDKSLAAIGDATRAEIYLRLNMAVEAVPLARRAVARFRAEAMRYDEGLALYTLGLGLARQGQRTSGMKLLSSAREFFRREGNRVRTAVIDLHLARLEAARGRVVEARSLARAAQRAFSVDGLRSRAAAAQVALAEIEVLAGNAAAADRALRAVPRNGDTLARFERAYLVGRIAEARGDSSRAIAAYGRASGMADLVRGSLAGEEHKIAVEEYRTEVADRAVSLLLSQVPVGLGSSKDIERRDNSVFRFVEGAKARALGDLLEGITTRREGSSGKKQHRSRTFEAAERRLAWYSAKLERAELDATGSAEVKRRLAREVARLERRIAGLHRSERETSVPRTHAGRKADRPVPPGVASTAASTLLASEHALLPGEVFVEYFCADGRLHAFRIECTSSRIVSLNLDLRTVESIASRFAFEIDTMRLAGAHLGGHTRSMVASASQRLREMYEMLIAPLGAIEAGARVTIVPHGVLHTIPFAALESPRGPLIEHVTVALSPSFDIFSRLRVRKPSTRKIDLVGGYADPCAPEIGDEVEAVGRALAGRSLEKRVNITSDDFFRLAPAARRIHLATHGRFRRDNPLFSALRFADRWVHLYEILELALDADLVVLSGCETGSGRRTTGEEMLGLARGFLARGARQLVVSLWPVEDVSAGRLASIFHAHHAGGASARDAIQRASLKIREDFPHPYHWSPFVLLGDGVSTHRQEKSK